MQHWGEDMRAAGMLPQQTGQVIYPQHGMPPFQQGQTGYPGQPFPGPTGYPGPGQANSIAVPSNNLPNAIM